MSSEPLAASPSPVAASRDEFCRACGRFATGVAVVTVTDAAGQPHGMTVNSFTSVSLNPLLFLVCIDYRASIFPVFALGRAIAINILAEDQRPVSTRFARPGEDRFGPIEWTPGVTGAPLLPGIIGAIEGVVEQIIPAGDHAILIARAEAVGYQDGRPLLYFQSRYRELGPSAG